jgi:multidrug efflux pump subunit AcrA (membrane-fusion protein)
MVVNDKKVVERRAVKLGTQEDDYRVVAEGLGGDDWVIVNGLLRAVPGKQVTPEKQTLPGPGGKTKAPATEAGPRKTAP